MRHISFILIIAVMFSGCATTAATRTSSDYIIRTGDELRVVIWKELDEKVMVRPDGRISLPLIGEVYCKDKTPKSLSNELSKKYNKQTTVIVAKTYSIKDDLKDLIGFLRDGAFFYFVGKRAVDD